MAIPPEQSQILEERVKMVIGDLMVSLQIARLQIEDLQKKLVEFEGQQSHVESIHRDRPTDRGSRG